MIEILQKLLIFLPALLIQNTVEDIPSQLGEILIFEMMGQCMHHFYLKLPWKLLVPVLFVIQYGLQRDGVEESLTHRVLQRLVAQHSQIAVHQGHQHVLLVYCDELLTDNASQVSA